MVRSPTRRVELLFLFMPYRQKTHGLSTEVNLIRKSGLRSNIAGEKSRNLVTLENCSDIVSVKCTLFWEIPVVLGNPCCFGKSLSC
jgi:hypothetical protein